MVARVLKRRASNCLYWLVMICCGQPKRATQTETKALATASAVISDRGSAPGQRAYLSMAVRQYRKPEETGSGPTRSICEWENRADGMMKFPRGAIRCCVTLNSWPDVHARVHEWQSLLAPGHTNPFQGVVFSVQRSCMLVCRNQVHYRSATLVHRFDITPLFQ